MCFGWCGEEGRGGGEKDGVLWVLKKEDEEG